MFNSTDKELNRLAQKLCHEYRISYWILVWNIETTGYKGVLVKGLEDINIDGVNSGGGNVKVTLSNLHGFDRYIKFHEIKLKKHGDRKDRNAL